MIKDKVFSANVTTYRNYLRGCKNSEKHVTVVPNITLFSLLTQCYENSCSFVYKINKY